jgi:hypothetical protein
LVFFDLPRHFVPVNTPCKICEKKRARRSCPGIGGEICPTCCATERENTIDCPLECEYLHASREHERRPPLNESDFPNGEFPNKDVKLSEDFLRAQEHLVVFVAHSLARAIEAAKGIDIDARDALDAMIRTFKTSQSGLIYESKPANPYAQKIQESLNQSIEDLHKRILEESGQALLKESDLLGVLVFLQRLEIQHNNGRRKSRAFLDFLRGYFPPAQEQAISA